AVLCPYTSEGGSDFGKGFVPRDLGPSARRTSDRAPEPIGIVVEFLEPVRLRADEAMRKRIVRVAAHGDDGFAVDFQRQTARRFAKRAHTVDGAPITHGHAASDTSRYASDPNGR